MNETKTAAFEFSKFKYTTQKMASSNVNANVNVNAKVNVNVNTIKTGTCTSSKSTSPSTVTNTSTSTRKRTTTGRESNRRRKSLSLNMNLNLTGLLPSRRKSFNNLTAAGAGAAVADNNIESQLLQPQLTSPSPSISTSPSMLDNRIEEIKSILKLKRKDFMKFWNILLQCDVDNLGYYTLDGFLGVVLGTNTNTVGTIKGNAAKASKAKTKTKNSTIGRDTGTSKVPVLPSSSSTSPSPSPSSPRGFLLFVETVFELSDVYNFNKITYGELFCTISTFCMFELDEMVKVIFYMFDRDKNGDITKDDMVQFCTILHGGEDHNDSGHSGHSNDKERSKQGTSVNKNVGTRTNKTNENVNANASTNAITLKKNIQTALESFRVKRDGTIGFYPVVCWCRRFPSVLEPAFRLQGV